MRIPALAAAFALVAGAPAFAQQQQAGNAASTNADATFQKLVEQCDDTDVLYLRAKIRLQLGRATEAAATEAQDLMDKGLAKCGEGDIAAAKTTLQQAYDVADAGVTQKFGQDATAEVAAKATAEPRQAAAAEEPDEKPWWKFW